MGADVLALRGHRDRSPQDEARERTNEAVERAKRRMFESAERIRRIDAELQRMSDLYQERLDGDRRE